MPNYSRSPIREAVFDIRVKFEQAPQIEVFEKVYDAVKTEYPKKEVNDVRFLSFEVKGKEQPKVNTGGGANGIRITSGDGSKVAQLRNDGFTFSKLKPYESWEKFSEDALKLFNAYVVASKPSYVERIALRYINAIEVPETNVDIDEYFNTAPQIGKSIPQNLIQFFSRMVIKDNKSDSVAIVNQTIEEGQKKDVTIFIFDIDVFHDNLRLKADSGDFKSRLEIIKSFRTTIFEGSITEKTKKLIA